MVKKWGKKKKVENKKYIVITHFIMEKGFIFKKKYINMVYCDNHTELPNSNERCKNEFLKMH